VMKTHTVVGAALLSGGRSELVMLAQRIARSHHERWDGTGYPDGLAGEAIPLEARLVAVADVVDALSHDRPYRPAWPMEDVLAELRRGCGTQFDPVVVDAFFKLGLDVGAITRAGSESPTVHHSCPIPAPTQGTATLHPAAPCGLKQPSFERITGCEERGVCRRSATGSATDPPRPGA